MFTFDNDFRFQVPVGAVVQFLSSLKTMSTVSFKKLRKHILRIKTWKVRSLVRLFSPQNPVLVPAVSPRSVYHAFDPSVGICKVARR